MVTRESTCGRRDEYLKLGLELLAESGARALTAVRAAAEMNVTTGSFYWHFSSVAEFHAAVRQYWREVVLVDVIEEAWQRAVADQSGPITHLGLLVRETGIYRYDDAMRRWAEHSPETAEMLVEADAWRGEAMAAMMGNTKVAGTRADLIGAAWRGSSGMPNPDRRFRLISLTTSAGRAEIGGQSD